MSCMDRQLDFFFQKIAPNGPKKVSATKIACMRDRDGEKYCELSTAVPEAKGTGFPQKNKSFFFSSVVHKYIFLFKLLTL